jgi:hypothetical protein
MFIFEDSIHRSFIESFALSAGIGSLRTRNDTGVRFKRLLPDYM